MSRDVVLRREISLLHSGAKEDVAEPAPVAASVPHANAACLVGARVGCIGECPKALSGRRSVVVMRAVALGHPDEGVRRGRWCRRRWVGWCRRPAHLCRCAGDGLRSVGQPRWHRRHADRPAPARFNRRKKPKRVPTRRYRAFQVQLLPKNVTVYCNVAAWLRAAHPPKHGQPHALSHPGGALHTYVCTIHRCRPRCRRATGRGLGRGYRHPPRG